MTDDQSIHGHINDLVRTEQELRKKLSSGQISADEEQTQLRAVEVELDQAWDLLRQRQARRDAGQDPEQATSREGDVVEKYLN